MKERRLRHRHVSTLILILVLLSSVTACASPQTPTPSQPAAALTAVPAAPTAAPVAPTAAAPTAAPAAAKAEPPAPGKSATVDQIRKNGVFRAGVAVSLPTLGQDPKTSAYFGPTIDFANAVADRLGVKMQPVESNWDVFIAGLQSNKFELAVAGLYATEERKKAIDFVTWTNMGFCHMLLKNNNKIQKAEDLNSSSVTWCTLTGTGTETEIMKKYPNAKIDSIVAPAGAMTRIEEVLAQRCDVTTIDSPMILVYQQTYPQIKALPQDAKYCFENPDMSTPVGFGLAKGDQAWKDFIQAMADETHQMLQDSLAKYSTPEYLKINQ